MFSLRAPIHPQKPMTNITPPLMMKMRAGSRVTVVILPMLENMSFSVQAQSPIPQIPAPTSCEKIHVTSPTVLNDEYWYM